MRIDDVEVIGAGKFDELYAGESAVQLDGHHFVRSAVNQHGGTGGRSHRVALGEVGGRAAEEIRDSAVAQGQFVGAAWIGHGGKRDYAAEIGHFGGEAQSQVAAGGMAEQYVGWTSRSGCAGREARAT